MRRHGECHTRSEPETAMACFSAPLARARRQNPDGRILKTRLHPRLGLRKANRQLPLYSEIATHGTPRDRIAGNEVVLSHAKKPDEDFGLGLPQVFSFMRRREETYPEGVRQCEFSIRRHDGSGKEPASPASVVVSASHDRGRNSNHGARLWQRKPRRWTTCFMIR
jgi:hypothetical protein